VSRRAVALVVVVACGYPNPAQDGGIGDGQTGGGDGGSKHDSGSGGHDGSNGLCSGGSMAFAYTGAPVTAPIPSCVTSITVDLRGASGGIANVQGSTGTGGLGARVQGTLAITAGSSITVYVGGAGDSATSSAGGAGGYNGGGSGGNDGAEGIGGGGGGASDVRIGGDALSDRVFVAAGGGGAGGFNIDGIGGNGGGATGGSGDTDGEQAIAAAGGGTQISGGAAGSCTDASCNPTTVGSPGGLGAGGAGGGNSGGGGGGAGYYGGGGGAPCSGAGGSSFASASATSVVETAGDNEGSGSVTISW
jgi:hypothetical protein